MNLTKEEIEEIKEALETHESFLNRIVNGTDIQATETNDREYARNRIEMIRIRLKNKFDNAHVIYLGENKHRVYKKSTEEDLMAS